MRRPSCVVVGMALALMTSACAVNNQSPPTTIETTTSTSDPSGSTLPAIVECPGAGEFGEGSGIAEIEGTESDAGVLGRISWSQSDLCETFTFSFETSEGAPATAVPDVRVSHLPSLQVLRIAMGIDTSVITDQLVETGLVDRLYVVRTLDGDMFVDLHLVAPAAARVRFQSSPAALTVDLRPGFLDFTGHSAIHGTTVVVDPTPSADVGQTTTFTGYSRTFEANVTAIITQGDEVVTRTNTTAADSIETWGEFSIHLPLPPGEVSVFLGEESPEDGSLDGVTLDLTVS